MSELRKIGRILPTRKNAEAMLTFTSEDLARAKITPAEIWPVADPENTSLVDAQQQRLKRHPERYLGAIAGHQAFGGTIEGFIKYNEWRIADQISFEDVDEAARLETIREAGHQELRGRPLGIFALHASAGQPEDMQLFITRTLVDEAIMRHSGREVRVGLHDSDPLTEFLVKKRGFRPTEQVGSPLEMIPDYQTRLHIRPAEE